MGQESLLKSRLTQKTPGKRHQGFRTPSLTDLHREDLHVCIAAQLVGIRRGTAEEAAVIADRLQAMRNLSRRHLSDACDCGRADEIALIHLACDILRRHGRKDALGSLRTERLHQNRQAQRRLLYRLFVHVASSILHRKILSLARENGKSWSDARNRGPPGAGREDVPATRRAGGSAVLISRRKHDLPYRLPACPGVLGADL